ncbi:MAG TPA: iron ABC transporter permease, partial [Methanoculleus sp.]|nr:iron ABC transporter permease [Methanoculleus sp.]
MHFADGTVPREYLGYVRRKHLWILGGIALLFILLVVSISVGAAGVPIYDVFLSIVNGTADRIFVFLNPGATMS